MEKFEDIYEKYYRKVYLFLLKLSGDSSLAEELTQDTLFKAFLHIDQYEGRSSLYTWLCTIAKNNWLAEIKRKKEFVDTGMDPEINSGMNVENEVLDRHMAELIREEIAHLPEPYGSVCAMKIYAELTYREIAAEFQKSESWAKMTFFRGKTMLMERIVSSFL